MKKIISLIFLMISFLQCKKLDSNTVPLIGIDSDGKEVTEYIGAEKYAHKLGIILNSFNHDLSLTLNSKKERNWRIYALIIGLSINIRIGVGIAGIGATPALILIFFRTAS